MTQEGRRLLAAATERPWRFPVGGAIVSIPGRDNVSFGEVKDADAALIVAAVNQYAALLDVADAAAALMDADIVVAKADWPISQALAAALRAAPSRDSTPDPLERPAANQSERRGLSPGRLAGHGER